MGFYSRYSAFGVATPPIVGALVFNEQWSADDWIKNSWNPDYVTPNPETINDAQTKWQALTEARDQGSSTAGTIIDMYSQSINDAAASIDRATKAGYYGQGQIQASTRINAFNVLTNIITQLSNVIVPDPDAEKQAVIDAQTAADARAAATAAKQAAAQAQTVAQAQQTQAAITAAQAATAAAKVAAAAAQAHTQAAQQQARALAVTQQMAVAQAASATGSSSTTPILLGVLGLGVVAAGFFALRHKKAAVSGYRKRSRR